MRQVADGQSDVLRMTEVICERLLSCYGNFPEQLFEWGRQSSIPTVMSKLIQLAQGWFGDGWPRTVFLMDACVEERMQLALLAPESSTIFALLGGCPKIY